MFNIFQFEVFSLFSCRYFDHVLINHRDDTDRSLVLEPSSGENKGSCYVQRNEEESSVRLISKTGYGFMPSSEDMATLEKLDG